MRTSLAPTPLHNHPAATFQPFQNCASLTALRLAGVLVGSGAGLPSGSKENLSLFVVCPGRGTRRWEGGEGKESGGCVSTSTPKQASTASVSTTSPSEPNPQERSNHHPSGSLDALRLLRGGAGGRDDRQRDDVAGVELARLALADLLALFVFG